MNRASGLRAIGREIPSALRFRITPQSIRMRRRVASLLAAMLAVTLTAPAMTSPAAASTPTRPTSTATIYPPNVDQFNPNPPGASNNAIQYEIDFDCEDLETGVSDTADLPDTPFAPTEGLFYILALNLTNGANCVVEGSGQAPVVGPDPGPGGSQRYFLMAQFSCSSSPYYIRVSASAGSSTYASWAMPSAGCGGSSSQTSSSAPDPTAGAVSVAAEQVAAAGVAGSSGAVRVRGGGPVPVSATVVSSVGPRGGVVVEGDGMRVAVASTLGASTGAGVRAPSGGLVDVSVSGPLTPGAVIEVWVRSEPRLVAAAAVPADYEDGDAVAFTVPLATPLDGGGAVEDGEHTLELRMYTADGFEVIATGLTVGSIAPTSIPAGEGPAVPSSLIGFGLLAAAGAVLVVRRQAVAG
jgi:hypothetical protein